MKKLFISVYTNQVGTDGHFYVEVPDNMSENDIEDIVQDLANDNAAMYDIYPPSDYNWPQDEDDDYEENYEEEGDDNIGGSWEIYDAEKHEGYQPGGGPSQWIKY